MTKKKDFKNPLVCIVAMNQNRVIGDGKDLIWHLPDDLQRFKLIPLGTPSILGRKHLASIGRASPDHARLVRTTRLTW